VDILQIIVLALVQGLTEFLPISSSAHLILVPYLTDWPDQGLAFDVAVHLGTLSAVLIYFRRDIYQIAVAWLRSWRGPSTQHSRMAWFLMIGTVPVGLAGLLLADFIETHLRSVAVIASTTILFGLLLGLGDKMASKRGDQALSLDQFSWKTAFYIGVAQAIALIPGTSRSGITMTAALMLGFNRQAAVRFSFLLSIPVIVMSGGHMSLGFGAVAKVPWGDMFLGFLLSGIIAFLTIHFFLRFINQMGMMPFVWYRLVLGAGLLIFLANGA